MATAAALFGDLGDPRKIDASVRAQLAESLAYIANKAADHLEIDRQRFDAALRQIRGRQQHPGVFARYFDLILAVKSNRFADANTLLAQVIERTSAPIAFAIVPYSPTDLESDYERFGRLLFGELSTANPMASPSPPQAAAATPLLDDAVRIVSSVDNNLYGEIQALLSRVYMTVPNRDPLARGRAKGVGGTSLMIWGGTFVNVEFHKTRWAAVQFLVHEITHSLLLGLSCDQPLVLNAPDENYESPLRSDLRPMDGVFHATLVCARLAAFNKAWLDGGIADEGDRHRTQDAVARNARMFLDGIAIVKQHGKLSDQGRYLVEQSCLGLSVFA